MHDKRYVSSEALQFILPLNGAVNTMPNRRTTQDMTLKDVKLQSSHVRMHVQNTFYGISIHIGQKRKTKYKWLKKSENLQLHC